MRFVWSAISYARDPEGRQLLRVRLHSDGPGVAYDVRWSIIELKQAGPDSDDWIPDRAFAEKNASRVIRALQPGEKLPPEDGDWLERLSGTASLTGSYASEASTTGLMFWRELMMTLVDLGNRFLASWRALVQALCSFEGYAGPVLEQWPVLAERIVGSLSRGDLLPTDIKPPRPA